MRVGQQYYLYGPLSFSPETRQLGLVFGAGIS
jgi:hypothetical protein